MTHPWPVRVSANDGGAQETREHRQWAESNDPGAAAEPSVLLVCVRERKWVRFFWNDAEKLGNKGSAD